MIYLFTTAESACEGFNFIYTLNCLKVLPVFACLLPLCLARSFLIQACTFAQPCGELDWGTKPEQNHLASTVPSLRQFPVLKEEGSKSTVDVFVVFSATVGLLQLKYMCYCDPREYIKEIYLAKSWAGDPAVGSGNVIFRIYRVSAVLYIRQLWPLHHCSTFP